MKKITGLNAMNITVLDNGYFWLEPEKELIRKSIAFI